MIKIRLHVTCILFLLAIYLIPILSFAAELQLVYEKSLKEIEHSDWETKIKQQKESHSEITVGLGDRYFYIVDGPKKTIYDFNKRRIFYLDEGERIYKDISLFYIIGYRDVEFLNRVVQGEDFRKVGVTEAQNPFELFELETLFSLEAKEGEKRQIKEQRKDASCNYVVNGETIVECSFAKFNVSEQNKDMFAKFLLYECNLHPRVWRSILAQQKIPQVFNYRFKNKPFFSYYVKLELKSVKQGEKDGHTIPHDYKIAFDPTDELDVIIHEVLTKQSKIKQLTRQDFIDFFHEAFNQGNYLDANLAIMEYGLQTGQDYTEDLKKVKPYFKTDRQLSLFGFAVNMANNKERAEEAIQALDTINRQGLKRGHGIDIIKADAKMALDKLTEAEELFLKVLKKNPHITGAYKDLGDVYYRTYQMYKAWKCWDTARFLYPDHSILEDIDKLEEYLFREYQEFF